jgi:CheY-like chemotaxis protein
VALERIFEPLFTTKGKAGSGLGLAIVKQIVSAHGGRIDVENIPGVGVVFHVLLVKAASPASERTEVESTSPWRKIRSVMVVDDEPAVGEGITGLLRMEGISCEWIDGGRAALERLEGFRPDLLILDVGLPDLNGAEVYGRASVIHPGLITIFSTGHGDQRIVDALSAPANVRVLSKPWDFSMLTACLAGLLHDTDDVTAGDRQ